MKKSTRPALELEDGAHNGHVRVLVPKSPPAAGLGLDVGDKYIHVCFRDSAGDILSETRIRTTREKLRMHFEPLMRCRVALEVGTHSRWIARELEDLGFEVYVANARKLRGIYQSDTKTDKCDARFLSEIVVVSPKLLCPLNHRGEQAQADLALIRARAALVRSRTLLINHVRSTIKSVGSRLATTSADAFHKHVDSIPESRHMILEPLMKQIRELTAHIRGYNQRIKERIASYPEAALLMRVSGVGPLVALAFVCTIEDPHRFRTVRSVGAYLGLRPRIDESGKIKKELRITKAGDGDMRRLLVNSAQFILGPLSPDSDLKRWGQKLVDRGGTAPKKKAAIAVARKLAVILLSIWRANGTYEPLRKARTNDENTTPSAAVTTCPVAVAIDATSKPETHQKKGSTEETAAPSKRERKSQQSASTSRPQRRRRTTVEVTP